MARSRNLKPGFFTNEDLGKLDDAACLLFAGLWCLADREGRLKDSPDWIKAHVFPYKRRSVDSLLQKLADQKFVVRYEVDGVRFIQVLNFLKHQTPHMKEPESLIPAPDLSDSGTSSVCHANIRGNQESGNGRGNQDAGARKFEPPTVDEVRAYCQSRGNGIDAEAFMAFYESNGWKVGKNPMKQWKSAIVTWEKNRDQFGTGKSNARTASHVGPGQRYRPPAAQ
jgi:hypothetical protein